MAAARKIVVVGGMTAGRKAAAKVVRLDPAADVTLVEEGPFFSYPDHRLPRCPTEFVEDQHELLFTAPGALHDPVSLQNVGNVRVKNRTEALKIDRHANRVRVHDRIGGGLAWLPYDKLVLATGATASVPSIPGVQLAGVFALHSADGRRQLARMLSGSRAREGVIVGASTEGVQIAEAMAERGCRITVVEAAPQILGSLDWEMAKLVEDHLESRGVRALTGAQIREIRGDGAVASVVTDDRSISAEVVVIDMGARPNAGLAETAGLGIGANGAVEVDERMRTSDPDIYAAGACTQCTEILTGQPCHVASETTALKQARVAAVNLCGGTESFPGLLGTEACKVFEFRVARTGLTEKRARALGYDVTVVLAPGPDRAHYMPGARSLMLKLVVDRASRRLLGAQAVGPGRGDKRIDVAAMAIAAGMTVDQVAAADLCYAPPFSPVMDNIITAANVVRNKLDGHVAGIDPMEVHRRLQAQEHLIFLDVRTPEEHEHVRLPGATVIPLGALRSRLDELPTDKEVVTFSSISLRGYEAALILKAAGFERVRVMDGGVEMWPFDKLYG